MIEQGFQLKGKSVIVTGATSGIGKAIALAFAKEGALVFGIGTNPEKGQAVSEQATQLNAKDNFTFYKADVSKREEVETAVQECINRFQKVDVLINCAGITRDGLLVRLKDEDWQRILDVNLNSCFYTCQAVMRPMMKARSGRIINVTSVVGMMGNPGQTNYAASKAGMIGFSKSLAKEVASRNILVNCVAPGFISTNMTDSMALSEEKKADLLKSIPLGRMGTPEEIAGCVLFLASPFASYITGQIITCDGGIAM